LSEKLCRPRSRWEENINKDLREIEVWVGFIWLRMGAFDEHSNEPLGSIKDTISWIG
jgi:hypothetical protein